MITDDQYIEHEVQIRVLKEVTSEKFLNTDKELKRLDSKMNWVLGLSISGVILPIFLKVIGVF